MMTAQGAKALWEQAQDEIGDLDLEVSRICDQIESTATGGSDHLWIYRNHMSFRLAFAIQHRLRLLGYHVNVNDDQPCNFTIHWGDIS